MRKTNVRQKVLLILPGDNSTATHFAHKWEMRKYLRNDLEFKTITMKHVPRGVLRIVWSRICGYKTFYVHYSFSGALIALLATGGGKVFYWNCGMPWLYKRSWLEEWIFHFILRHSIFVTGTHGLAEEYQKRYSISRKNTRILPNYLDVRKFQYVKKEQAREELGIAHDKRVVLFLHRLSRRKGAHLLGEIIRALQQEPNIFFVIVGDGPEREYVSNIRQEFNFIVRFDGEIKTYDVDEKGNIKSQGDISRYRIPCYFAAADLFIMPSEEEGFPHVLLEAMAAGVPFVASDVGGVKEIIPPELHEYAVPYGDIAALTGEIKKLFANEGLRKSISATEQKWVEQYDVSKVAPKFLEMLTK